MITQSANRIKQNLPEGSTIAPLIISPTKLVSRFGGDENAWPFYLTIGNINKAARCEANGFAAVLVRYFACEEIRLNCDYEQKNRPSSC